MASLFVYIFETAIPWQEEMVIEFETYEQLVLEAHEILLDSVRLEEKANIHVLKGDKEEL